MQPRGPEWRFPASVYRIQLSRRFTICQATELLPYLKELGVEGIYCSPYHPPLRSLSAFSGDLSGPFFLDGSCSGRSFVLQK